MTSFNISRVSPRAALIALNAVSGLTPRIVFQLSQREDFWLELINTPVHVAAVELGISEKSVINLTHFPAIDFLMKEEAKAAELGARLITIRDDDYPCRLREIADPPVALYVKGRLPDRDDAVIAIVGSRQATAYGLGIAEQFAMRMAEAGAAVISGMALGIDAAAHRGTLKAGGRTIAVLGCGLDVIYPQRNRELHVEVPERGCLISEFPFGALPMPYNFPRRNRIVSALSHGVLVVEANARSGALITAEFAMEQGREVYAVPGRIDSLQSRGPHELLRHGAKLVLCVDDIFDDIPGLRRQPELFPVKKTIKAEDLTADEIRVFGVLEEGRCSFDTLTARAELPLPALMGVILSLQLRRLVRELPGKYYELN